MIRLKIDEIKGITNERHELELFATEDSTEIEYHKDLLFKEDIFQDLEDCHYEWPDE